MIATRWLLLAPLAGCTRIPTALRPEGPSTTAPTHLQPTDLSDAATMLATRDPLVRRPPALDLSDLPASAGRDGLAEALERIAGGRTAPADLHALERSHPASLAVPLARGASLAEVESRVAGGVRTEDQGALLALLAPLSETDRTAPGDVREPLAWLAPRDTLGPALLATMERRVLLGWLASPDLPQQSLANAFTEGVHDRLVDSPAGALLLARARGAHDDSGADQALADLRMATLLGLQQAGADRDSQQRAFREALDADRAVQLSLGRTLSDAHDAPLQARLEAARTGLTATAADDRAAGLAIVALTAQRIVGSGDCGGAPCKGLDRTRTLQLASAWGPEPAAHGLAWRCVAAKRAADTLAVTLDQPTWGVGADLLVDVLLSEARGPVDSSLLRQARPAPPTWLALTRAAGAPDATDAERGVQAVEALAADLCDQAAKSGLPADAAAQAAAIAARLRPD
ncbi:MAG: hypothetical protein H6742_02285 [Alphaproteobacteria bacterium]|nr:hypothetical protein [Alphaproteobacteria bacterium]